LTPRRYDKSAELACGVQDSGLFGIPTFPFGAAVCGHAASTPTRPTHPAARPRHKELIAVVSRLPDPVRDAITSFYSAYQALSSVVTSAVQDARSRHRHKGFADLPSIGCLLAAFTSDLVVDEENAVGTGHIITLIHHFQEFRCSSVPQYTPGTSFYTLLRFGAVSDTPDGFRWLLER